MDGTDSISVVDRPVLKADSAPSPLLRLFMLATVPPALIVALDEWAILYGTRNHWNESALAILYTLYVVQVAALTGFVGRFVNGWFLRWTILIWVLLLIDLRLFTFNSSQCLTFAFLSGQLSLLVFITTLGPGPWPWRLPSAMAAGVIVLYLVLGNSVWREAWSTVLILQTLVTFPLFLLLLLAGYRIRPQYRGVTVTPTDAAQHGFSFSIKHMLFWMLAAVPHPLRRPTPEPSRPQSPRPVHVVTPPLCCRMLERHPVAGRRHGLLEEVHALAAAPVRTHHQRRGRRAVGIRHQAVGPSAKNETDMAGLVPGRLDGNRRLVDRLDTSLRRLSGRSPPAVPRGRLSAGTPPPTTVAVWREGCVKEIAR